MDITLEPRTKVITIHYKDEQVHLVISSIARNIIAVLNVINPVEGDLFQFMTAYINECLTTEEKDRLVDLYKSIDDIAQTLDDMVPIRLGMLLSEIQEILNYDNLLTWVLNNKDIEAPPDIRKSYDTEKDTEGLIAPDKTYIVEEYKRLCAYTLMTRMVAIAIHGFDNMLSDYYRNEIKPQVYFDMLDGTPLRTSEEYHKLKRYVDSNRADNFARNAWAKEAFLTTMSLRGISEDMIDSYVMGVVVLNTLSTYPILQTRDNKNLIKKIYRTAVYTINNVSSSVADTVRVVRVSGSDVASDDSQSVLESHRVSPRITIGVITEIQHYYRDPMAVFTAGCKYPIDQDMYSKVMTDLNSDESIRKGQLALTSGILAPIIRTEVLLYVKKEAVLGYMVIAAIMARDAGYSEVAKLILAIPDTSPQHVMVSSGAIQKPSTTTTPVINKMLPYYDNIYTVKKTASTRKSNGAADMVLQATSDITTEAMVTRTSEEVNFLLYGDRDTTIWLPVDITDKIVLCVQACQTKIQENVYE